MRANTMDSPSVENNPDRVSTTFSSQDIDHEFIKLLVYSLLGSELSLKDDAPLIVISYSENQIAAENASEDSRLPSPLKV